MAAAARKVNWFAVWVSAAVVVAIVAVGGLVVVLNNAATGPGEAPQAANVDAETGAISVGDGENTLATYIDFMCPVCGDFEAAYGPEIDGLVEDGSTTLEIHPISILDRVSQGTEFSTRAANAMYCVAVADEDAALPFLQAMFAAQPAEGSAGLTDDEILSIASSVGVDGVDACVTDQTYSRYVGSITQETPVQPGAAGIATPTLTVNGEVISNSEIPAPGQLATLFG
ncbi:thioredoxin domain-containing protein [Microbacterium sp. NPDC077184]|uniref:DsbA family protein n=1 Tax=Microbacterium sp. NPDC077184 TaxID=3154764 RepID=UPI003432E4F0